MDVKEIQIRTIDFEKILTALQQVLSPFEVGKKKRVIVEYDPEKVTTKVSFQVGE